MREDTEHCDDCDACVEELDHHCPWTGKCIAKGNMVPFQIFLFMTFTLIVYYGVIAALISVDMSNKDD